MTGPERVRFAPSPTGALHIGGAHTALFNWLWARRTGGRFVLRIEDTDRERSTPEYERTILEGLRWMGLDWDEGPDAGGAHGPYRQSERLDLYRSGAERLLKEGKAYREGEAIIFRVEPDQLLRFEDLVYGPIEMKSETFKDIVLMKSDGMPTYNYAVVADDAGMGITTVIRGEDHIMNTPKQLLLYRALGWPEPRFAHLPMILGKDKKKLSKRHGATSVFEYADFGYLPDAVFNFLALLGWTPRNGEEVFSRRQAVEWFELERVTKRAAVFDMDKLNYVNQEHIKRMEGPARVEAVRPFWRAQSLPCDSESVSRLDEAIRLLAGRGQTLKEVAEYSDYLLSFDPVTARYDGSDLDETRRERLRSFGAEALSLPEFTAAALEERARKWCEERGIPMKELAMPLRFALTGRKVSPGIFDVAVFLGREETRRRLEHYGLA
jgi:glutamyl-tRNA synthetase